MLNRASQARVSGTRDKTFPAPVRGWVKSGNITTATPDQAEVLDNFFPTAQSARLRSGFTEYADLGAAVKRLMVYSSGSDTMFASTATGIFDADRINGGGANFADVYGLGSGDWSGVQISTSGGQFLSMVNGTDYLHYFDGTDWNPINGAAVNTVGYDALTANFSVGETVTGGTSGASATILSIVQTSATAGDLRVGAITSGPFQDDEAITSAGGAATADGASASSSAVTITGVATTALSQAWVFKNRTFFVEGGTMSAWYLPVESIGGAATEIPLGAVFGRGGSLLLGATWSLDSGSGIDDVCLFISTNGEVAVYEGTDPSSASTWALAGVYEIAAPLNKHATFKAGGDLAILTKDGIIPISEALRKDRAALKAVAISAPIEDEWKRAVANSSTISTFPLTGTLWQSRAQLFIGVPGAIGITYVANAQTGAWCRYTGWDVRCSAVSSDEFYFGSEDGIIRKGETGGTDGGVAYIGRYVPKFSQLGRVGRKSAVHACAITRASSLPDFRMTAFKDYSIGSYPVAPLLTTTAVSTWGTGIWGTFIWGDTGNEKTFTQWKTVGATGYSLAPVIVTSSNQDIAPKFDILATILRFEDAGTL